MPKSPRTIEQAHDVLSQSLRALNATGQGSLEWFLAEALSEFTDQPFYVAKSGHQGGSDVRSSPGNHLRIGLEAKRYRASSKLQLDALLHKITNAASEHQPVDLWVLAATRSVSVTDREKLHACGNQSGIDVLVLDWPNKPTRPCDLAVICVTAERASEKFLKPEAELSDALEAIRSDSEFEGARAQLIKRLTQADVGYANARQASQLWIEEAQASLPNAKSRLGGHHNLRESEFGVVSRMEVRTQLNNWLASDHGVVALLGDEGTGKSWAVIDWHNELTSDASAPLPVFLSATTINTSEDVKSTIANALCKQTELKSSAFWKRRLQLWETCKGDGVCILVLIDGLNENSNFINWAGWLQPLFEDYPIGKYRVVVSCWPDWWQRSLYRLANLAPPPREIKVEQFDERELNALLVRMGLTRSDFAPDVLDLMRVPRLSSLVMTHRAKLKDSGDVTAERVIYEDWKDRLCRHGTKVGLSDEELKAFVSELGKKLQKDIDQVMTRGDVVRILSDDSGRAFSELKSAVADLVSGRWLQPGKKVNSLKVNEDRIPFALAAALMANVPEDQTDAAVLENKIAEFFDPLKAHSLGAAILRAATTISFIETRASSMCRKVFLSKWLNEKNFRNSDFEAFWRLVGIHPNVVLDLAEEWWLARNGRTFTDEVLIKGIANTVQFPEFKKALQYRLARWLGTAWPDPMVGKTPGQEDPPSSASKVYVATTQWRHRQWVNSDSAATCANIQLGDSDHEWSWLSARALAILSYIDRAPFMKAIEAWALSRAIMDRPLHQGELAWVMRLNQIDASLTAARLRALLQRLGSHDHPICRTAIDYLEAAISHVRRDDTPLEIKDFQQDDTTTTLQVSHMSYGDVMKATQKYFLPDGWKALEPETGPELVNALVSQAPDNEPAAIQLVVEHIQDILIALTPSNRTKLRKAIADRLAQLTNSSDNDEKGSFRLRSALLLLEIYDAEPEKQSNLILNGEIGSEIDAWLASLHPISIADVGQPGLDDPSEANISRWLTYLGERLHREEMGNLEFLPKLIVSDDVGIRTAALRIAIYGRHNQALEAFARSSHSDFPAVDQKSGRHHEYLRNQALLVLHDFAPPQQTVEQLNPEYVALIAKHRPDDANAIEQFNQYLRKQLIAIRDDSSWSSPRYWQSYKEVIDTLLATELDSFLRWLRPWLEQQDSNLHRALLDDFPVLDLMRALSTLQPAVSIELYNLVLNQSRDGIFSSDQLWSLPFLLPRSNDADALCSQQIAEATDDKSLSRIAITSHKHDRTDWLFELIKKYEQAEAPIDVAKAYTLLGFCDSGIEADNLWEFFFARPPTDPWLLNVMRSSFFDYRENQRARIAFSDVYNERRDSLAHYSLKSLIASCDRRMNLWIKDIQPDRDKCPYERRLIRGWATSRLIAAMQKKDRAREKKFLHTPMAYSFMAPWR